MLFILFRGKKPNDIIVTFDSNGGSVVESVKLKEECYSSFLVLLFWNKGEQLLNKKISQKVI